MAGNVVRVATQVTGTAKASSDLDRLRDKFERLQKQGAKGFAIGAGAAITAKGLDLMGIAASAAADFIGDSIGAASDMNETLSKSKVIFGGSAEAVEDFGNTAAKSMGISKQAAIEASATFGNLFVGLDLGQQKAADMSKGIVTLAGDLASFNNLDPTVVLKKPRSGLAGEAEPLRSVGVFLSETKVKAKAAELGLAGAHGELTEGAKVLARYQLIMEETTTAQGDFARTADGLANSQRTANAQLRDQQAILGEKLLPTQLALTQAQVKVVDNLAATTTAVRAGSMGWIGMFEALGDTGDALDDLILRGGKTQAEVNALDAMADNAADTFRRHMYPALKKTADGLDDVADKADDVQVSWEDLVSSFEAGANRLAGVASSAADAIYDPLIRKAELAENLREVEEQRAIIASKKSTAEQVADAKARIVELAKARLELIAVMVGAGEASATQITTLNDTLRRELLTATDDEKAAIMALLELLDRLAAKGRATGKALRFTSGGNLSVGGGFEVRQHGGPAIAGRPIIVGEKRPELFVPNVSGTILPSVPTISAGAISGSDAAARWLPVIAAQLARLTAQEPAAARPQTARGDLARQTALMPGGRL